MTVATQPSSTRPYDDYVAGADLTAMVDGVVARSRDAGEQVILHHGRRTLTGVTLAEQVQRVSQAFARQGMRPGDVVLLGTRPGVDSLVVVLACMRNGAVITLVDPGLGSELFDRRLEVLRPAWVIADSVVYAASAPTPFSWYLRRKGLELPRLARVPGRHIRVGPRIAGLVPRSLSLRQLEREHHGEPVSLPSGLDPDAPSIIVFTSGTTGAPKGVQHSGRSVVGAMRMMLSAFELPERATFYTHDLHAIVAGMLHGAGVVVSPYTMTPERFLSDVEQHGVTHAFLLPIDAWRIALHCEQAGRLLPDCLQQLYLFSAPVTTTVLERVHRAARPELAITCIYAMTEMIPVTWIDSRDKLAWSGEGDVVGRPALDVEVRVVDDELEVRGASTFLGYLGHDPVDWHRTGDLARIDDAGNVVLMGRAKDMLIRDGFNLYPGLYEETISRIAGVGACALVGVPDAATANERVVLYVERDPTAVDAAGDQLRRRIERGMREGDTRIDVQALPDEVRVLDSLPRSGRSHKVDRKALRVLAAAPTTEVTP
jgi:acyl-CoA synthetase (AMP-forming)/AMP-acid ligase II